MNTPRRILVICLRRIGDVLLATPLIRSLKQAWPEAQIDALVFASTAAVLAGNPDLDTVIAWQPKAGNGEKWRRIRQLWRHYDLAVAATNSDRAHYAAWIAARHRVVVGPPEDRLKALLLQQRIAHDPGRLHAVTQSLLLADRLGIPRVPSLMPPRPADESALDALLGLDWRSRRYAVVHPQAMFRYKSWTAAGWQALIRWLSAQGLWVLLSSGPDAAERAVVQALVDQLALPEDALLDLGGRLPFAALTPLIERAALYVGPDTSTTHLAAATGAPTLALFGPSSPVTWGPWPKDWAGSADSPWQLTAPFQRIGNVVLLQADHGRRVGCIPCMQEGCERHISSASDCLDRLGARRVIAAAAQLLGVAAPA